MSDSGRACHTCRYFEMEEPGPIVLGVCHRYPPRMPSPTGDIEEDATQLADFPRVHGHDWCGEYD